MLKVYISGATGYIGGSILSHLLKANKFKISALTRSQEKAEKLKSISVTPIIGTIDDADIVSAAAYDADIVIEVANCDHLGNAQAIVAGLEKKFKETNKKQIFIHTSGSGILFDPKNPMYGELNPTVYVDTNEEQMASLPVTNLHRNVDTFIIQHSDAYTLVIVAPSLIYGLGVGPEGIANPHSIQTPVS
jgi:putative NADH-flavin reductase